MSIPNFFWLGDIKRYKIRAIWTWGLVNQATCDFYTCFLPYTRFRFHVWISLPFRHKKKSWMDLYFSCFHSFQASYLLAFYQAFKTQTFFASFFLCFFFVMDHKTIFFCYICEIFSLFSWMIFAHQIPPLPRNFQLLFGYSKNVSSFLDNWYSGSNGLNQP